MFSRRLSYVLRFAPLVLLFAVALPVRADFSTSFNSDSGGFTSSPYPSSTGNTAQNPWTWSAVGGAGGDGAWAVNGYNGSAGTGLWVGQQLTSPTLAVTAGTPLTLQFNHSFAFEPTWDGGQVLISVNGGSFDLVPDSAFTANGYNTTMQPNTQVVPMQGERAFSGSSGGYLTTTANLGAFNLGDTIQLQFVGGWDEWISNGPWVIDDVSLSGVFAVPVPEPSTTATAAAGVALWLAGRALRYLRRSKAHPFAVRQEARSG